MASNTPSRAVKETIEPALLQSASTSQTPSSSSQKRRAAQSRAQKIECMLDQLEEVRWSLPKFLEEFFLLEETKKSTVVPVERSDRHKRVVNSMFNGATPPRMFSLMESLYKNAHTVNFRTNDKESRSLPPASRCDENGRFTSHRV